MTEMTDAKPAEHHGHDVFKVRIDRENFEVTQATFSGQQLRNLPHPPIGDDRDLYEEITGGEDKLIAKTDVVALKDEGITAFFTSPTHVTPGMQAAVELLQADREYLVRKGYRYEAFVHGAMTAVVIFDFMLPPGYQSDRTNLLILLPGGFPEAAPDMWWCEPQVRLASGADPVSTSVGEQIGGRTWQRFSRHFTGVRWQAGRSGVESYVTLIRSDLAKVAQAARP
jgi:hypothetical protein